jgi:hypothetical protein
MCFIDNNLFNHFALLREKVAKRESAKVEAKGFSLSH